MDLRSSAHKFLCDIVVNFRRFFAARIPFNAHRYQPRKRNGCNCAASGPTALRPVADVACWLLRT